ncbi:VCBS repeat-containing protein [Emticicia sp. 21SJ11W-3]|uniref:FG-GAP repeat domain-containing protein n=1 Tax=Emticicia sp. 21SJ11W-3 TaxID=2916755 RepID=UPI0020A229C1|nr:VCBS repeat-containing protein [Emticicia sp. 21SJ11W-3]UTA66377.1 VCBS repeat-containing protein [Emticicia sp. 21SJ11W-3]
MKTLMVAIVMLSATTVKKCCKSINPFMYSAWYRGVTPSGIIDAGYPTFPRFYCDINKDGIPDYGRVVGNFPSDRYLSFALGKSDGRWQEYGYSTPKGFDMGYLSPEPFLADVNNDGYLDYVRGVGNPGTYKLLALPGTKDGFGGPQIEVGSFAPH